MPIDRAKFQALQQQSGGLKKKPAATSVTNPTIKKLTKEADKAGLGAKVAKQMPVGEDINRYFGGGVISDAFDILNTLQYGTVGLAQGKSFLEGIKTRSSFTDVKEFKDAGIPGLVSGIALDIAFDPLTYVSPKGVVTFLGKSAGLAKASGKVKKAAGVLGDTSTGKKIADFFGEKFVYRYGQDPIYKELAERSVQAISKGRQTVIDLVRPLAKLDPATQRVIGEARKAGNLDSLAPDVLAKAKPAFDELDRLGKEAVDLGFLDKAIYDENVGQYMARLYKTKETLAGKIKGIFGVKPKGINLDRFMSRKDIPDEIRSAMGEILEAGYPTAKGLVQLSTAVENGKFFREVSSKFGKDAFEDGLTKLPTTRRLGELSGKFVPDFISKDLQYLSEPLSTARQVQQKIVGAFKYGKVVLNPATHMRNVYSNMLLNNFEGLSPLRGDIYFKAARELKNKGKVYQEAAERGLGVNTYAASELKDFFIGPEFSRLSGLGGAVRNGMDRVAQLYEKEEEFAKLAQYIYQKGKGLAPDDAWKIAERATFNYAQVTPFIRKLRTSMFGFPFITFTAKATPQVIKTAYKAPTKISNIGKIKNAIENYANPEELTAERAVEPDYIKNGFFIKLPNKDKYGRSGYFDMTYILPFGDLLSGNLFESEKSGEPFTQAALRKTPFLNLINEIARNEDFLGNPIVRGDSTEPWEQGGDLFKYLVKALGPPVATDLPFRMVDAVRAEAEQKDKYGRPLSQSTVRTAGQEFARGFLGLKVTPFQKEAEKKKRERELQERIENILVGSGARARFDTTYKPKP